MPNAESIPLFLSYAHHDRHSVHTRIIANVNDRYKLWYDIEIPPGADFWEEIEKHIMQSRIFLFALSPNSLQSEACLRELELAHKCGIRILPIMIDKTDENQLPKELKPIQWLDLTGIIEEKKQRLVDWLDVLIPTDSGRKPSLNVLWLAAVLFVGLLVGFVAATLIVNPAPPVPTLTPSPTPPVEQTLRSLIDRETQAVLTQNGEEIAAIYIADAIIEDADPNGRIYYSALTYYAGKWAKEVHCRVEHPDVEIVVLTTNYARIMTSSEGEFGYRVNNNGCPIKYDNPRGADIWEFARDEFGEWLIVRFTYNAHNK